MLGILQDLQRTVIGVGGNYSNDGEMHCSIIVIET